MAIDNSSDAPVPPGPGDDAADRIALLELKLSELEFRLANDHYPDPRLQRQRDWMRVYYAMLGFVALLFAGLLIGRHLEFRYRLESERLRTAAAARSTTHSDSAAAPRNTAPQQDAPAGPVEVPAGKVVTGPLTPHQIIERYIDLHAQRPEKPGADFTLSVNGAVDLVKSLGNVGMISAEAAGNLVKKLQDEGIAVGAYTLKKLVDAALEPAPASAKQAGGANAQHVLVNIYTRGQPVVSYGPPATDNPPVRPPPRNEPTKDKPPKNKPPREKPPAGAPEPAPACPPAREACVQERGSTAAERRAPQPDTTSPTDRTAAARPA